MRDVIPGNQRTGSRPRLLLVVSALVAVGFCRPALGDFVESRFPVSNLRAMPSLRALETEPDVAGPGDTLVAVWTNVGDGNCRHRVGYASSFDFGATWTYLGNALGTNRGSGQPSIYWSGESYYVVMTACVPEKALIVRRGSFEPAGLAWSPSVQLNFPRLTGIPTLWPEITGEPGTSWLYVCYTELFAWPSPVRTVYSEVRFVRSADGGLTWTAPVAVSGARASGGRLVVGPGGEVYVFWRDHVQQAMMGRRSLDHGASFEPAFVVAEVVDAQGGRPPGWEPQDDDPGHPTVLDCVVADRPVVAVDLSPGPRRGSLYLAWAEGAVGEATPYAGVVGEQEPNDSYATANQAFVGQALAGTIPSADRGGDDQGDYWWFEGTEGMTLQISGTMSSSAAEDLLVYEFQCEGPTGTIQTIDRCNWLGQGYQVLPVRFTFPATGRYFLRTPPSGPSSRSYFLALEPVVLAGEQVVQDHRDVVLVSSADGGVTWSPKVRVNDDPPRFDNALPAVAVDGAGQVHVSWFDRRHATDCGSTSVHTRWSWSADGGRTFAPSAQLSTLPSEYAQYGEKWRIGSYQALVPVNGRVMALWSQMVGFDDADVHGALMAPDIATAILLSGFAADRVGERARLRWYLSRPGEVAWIRVHRAVDGGAETIPAGGEFAPRPAPGLQTWEDADAPPGHSYRYRLEVTTLTGATVWAGPAELASSGHRLALRPLGPNPFRGATGFELRAAPGAPVTVEVFDVAGQRVRVLRRGVPDSGRLEIRWDGADGSGRQVPSGLYLVRARAAAQSATLRVLRVE